MRVPWSEKEWERVMVYGLGRSGLAAAAFLRSRGVTVVGVDRREELDLGSLAGDPGLELRLGAASTLPDAIDAVVLSPGVPRQRPMAREADARGIPVIAEVELAFPFLDGPVLAITGSNGKSTTAALTSQILRCAGLPEVLCGNFGEPLCSKIDGAVGRIFIVELSSFQLESVHLFSAQAAALLNISPDHLDRYPDVAAYAAAKARVFERQGTGSTAVLNAEDQRVMDTLGGIEHARKRFFSRRRRVTDGCYAADGVVVEAAPGSDDDELFAIDEIILEGTHNLENAMAAALLARAVGAQRQSVRRGVGSFAGLPHRMQKVSQSGGFSWYDDSKGTNVGATRESLEGFPGHSVHLILGGQSKGADFLELRGIVASKARAVYLIGEAADDIATALEGAAPIVRAGTLDEAVRQAAARAEGSESVVLSPACASFDQFDSFEHRGRRFQQLVAELDGASDA